MCRIFTTPIQSESPRAQRRAADRRAPEIPVHGHDPPQVRPTSVTMKSSSFPASTANDTDWNDLSQAVRDLIEAHTGPVWAARTVPAGLNSQFAAVLDTENGPLFIKGLRTDHPGVVRQRREAMINPYVVSLTPQLHWRAEGAGWNLLAFAYIPGARHAEYLPGSADQPAVVQVIKPRCGQRNAPPGRRRQTMRSMFSPSRAPGSTTRSPAVTLNPGRSVSRR